MVCDIRMPEEGGNTPAIALTGNARIEDRIRALEAGYEMFVPKPVQASELCSMVASLVGGDKHPAPL